MFQPTIHTDLKKLSTKNTLWTQGICIFRVDIKDILKAEFFLNQRHHNDNHVIPLPEFSSNIEIESHCKLKFQISPEYSSKLK